MASMWQSSRAGQEGSRALRLTFEYAGTQVRLTSRQLIEKIPPPSDSRDEYEGHAGFWIELRDPEGRVLYRRVMHSPIQFEYEAPSGDPEKPFTHVKVQEPKGAFTVFVPDYEDGQALSLFGSPPDRPREAAKEILRVNLKEQHPPQPREHQAP